MAGKGDQEDQIKLAQVFPRAEAADLTLNPAKRFSIDERTIFDRALQSQILNPNIDFIGTRIAHFINKQVIEGLSIGAATHATLSETYRRDPAKLTSAYGFFDGHTAEDIDSGKVPQSALDAAFDRAQASVLKYFNGKRFGMQMPGRDKPAAFGPLAAFDVGYVAQRLGKAPEVFVTHEGVAYTPENILTMPQEVRKALEIEISDNLQNVTVGRAYNLARLSAMFDQKGQKLNIAQSIDLKPSGVGGEALMGFIPPAHMNSAQGSSVAAVRFS